MLKEIDIDVAVVGTGISGLYTSLLSSEHGKVLLLSKGKINQTNTQKAQGGIAVALDKKDSPNLHEEDTIKAGSGLCDAQAVKILTHCAQTELGNIVKMGAKFDKDRGRLNLGLEAAHSKKRIVHAGEDTTGRKLQDFLSKCVYDNSNIIVKENLFAIDLRVNAGKCEGLWAFDIKKEEIVLIKAKAVVFCTGGLGQLYFYSTNETTITGDGLAMAFRAGGCLVDMEFIQFHPTVLYKPALAAGEPMFLITEALRGAGALLVNLEGEVFMIKYHPRAELAPRDIVTRAIFEEIHKSGRANVFLNIGRVKNFKRRFSAVYEACKKQRIDLSENQIPVIPAAHYLMGGVKADIDCKTGIGGFFVSGETSCFGTHGANRLAGNSLLEGLVFSRRAGDSIGDYLKETAEVEKLKQKESLFVFNDIGITDIDLENVIYQLGPHGEKLDKIKANLQEIMWAKVGITRNSQGLTSAIGKIQKLSDSLEKVQSQILAKSRRKTKTNILKNKKTNTHLLVKFFELKNMLLLARLVAEAAKARTESRGAHFRIDFPVKNDSLWLKHLSFQKLSSLEALKLYR